MKFSMDLKTILVTYSIFLFRFTSFGVEFESDGTPLCHVAKIDPEYTSLDHFAKTRNKFVDLKFLVIFIYYK